MDRVTLGRMQNPIRGFLHGAAAVGSVVALAVLLTRAAGNGWAVMAALIFGIALLVMYTVSTLYHSVPWNREWKLRLQRTDHAMIFLVVAGTFTPIAIAALDGLQLAIALGFIWVLGLTGIVLKALLPNVRTILSLTLQMVMGWSAIIWIPTIQRRLGTAAVVLIGLGGLCYTLGVVVFATKRPRLFPRIFSYHELFHVLVIAGSTIHFLVILWYAMPAIS